jgi:hypothetical protein
MRTKINNTTVESTAIKIDLIIHEGIREISFGSPIESRATINIPINSIKPSISRIRSKMIVPNVTEKVSGLTLLRLYPRRTSPILNGKTLFPK